MGYLVEFGRSRSNRVGLSRGSQKFGDAGPLLLSRGCLNPEEYAPPSLCYHAEFGRSRSNRVGLSRGSQKFGDAGPLILSRGVWTRRNTPLPHCVTTYPLLYCGVTMKNLVALGQTVWASVGIPKILETQRPALLGCTYNDCFVNLRHAAI